MSVTLVNGDLFESSMQTIVNATNCCGKMGKGIALEFKKRFPQMYDDYTRRCGREKHKLGEPYLFIDSDMFREKTDQYILNFPTVHHWRDSANIQDIKNGLDYLHANYKKWGITSLAVPALGCGCANLSWQQVKPVLVKHFEQYDIPVEIFEPHKR